MSLTKRHECNPITRSDRYFPAPDPVVIEEHLSKLDALRMLTLKRKTPNYVLVNRCDEIERWLHMNLAYVEGNVPVLIPLREQFTWSRPIYSARQFLLASAAAIAYIDELPSAIEEIGSELGFRPEWRPNDGGHSASWRGRADVLPRIGMATAHGRTADARAKDPAVRSSFFEHLRAGYDIAVVAVHVGISYGAAYAWSRDESRGDAA